MFKGYFGYFYWYKMLCFDTYVLASFPTLKKINPMYQIKNSDIHYMGIRSDFYDVYIGLKTLYFVYICINGDMLATLWH